MAVATLTTVTVTAAVTYPATPQIALEFDPSAWLFLATACGAAGTTRIYISMDGIADHYYVVLNRANEGLSVTDKQRKVWFRRENDAAAGAVTCTAMANTDT